MVEEEEKDEIDSYVGDGKKTKENPTPLWTYVTRLGGGRWGGTTKFTCPHCGVTYTFSYTCVRKHLCGVMPWDENKTIGVKNCKHVPSNDRAKYKREEEEAHYLSKKARVEQDTASSHRTFSARSPSTHGNGFSPSHSRHRKISYFLDQGGRDDVDAKVFRFLYACGIPFNVLCSPYWHEMVEAIRSAPAGYRSLGYDKARTVGLDSERAKINSALGKFTNDWSNYGVSIVSDGWTNVEGKPLINMGNSSPL